MLSPFGWTIRGFYKIRLAEKVFTLDGVPVFWAVFGYFLGGRQYKNILKKSVSNVLMPGVVVLCLYVAIQPWLYGLGGVGLDSYPWKEVLFNLTHRGKGMTICPHLWYVFRYAEVALLSFLWLWMIRDAKRRKRYLGIGIVILLLTTIGQYGGRLYGRVDLKTVSAVVSPMSSWISIVCYILLGSEMHEYTLKIQNRRIYYFKVGLAVFLGANAARLILQYIIDRVLVEYADKTLMGTVNIFSFVSTLGLLLLFLSVNVKSAEAQNVIRWLGGKAFGIYLIHWAVREKLASVGFGDFLRKLSGTFGEIAYSLIYTIMVFVISLLLVVLFEKAMCLLKMGR